MSGSGDLFAKDTAEVEIEVFIYRVDIIYFNSEIIYMMNWVETHALSEIVKSKMLNFGQKNSLEISVNCVTKFM